MQIRVGHNQLRRKKVGKTVLIIPAVVCFKKSFWESAILKQPANLQHFSIQEKQEKRGTSEVVSYIRYMELVYKGNRYRLNNRGNLPFNITINGIQQRELFTGEVSAQLVSGRVILSIPGVSVSWDGNQATEISLCNTYKNLVCGLCGNFDGKLFEKWSSEFIRGLILGSDFFENWSGIANNDLEDRDGKQVKPVGTDRNTMYTPWGSKWRVFDDAPDANPK